MLILYLTIRSALTGCLPFAYTLLY